jgi:hypothetical protein
MYSLNGVPLNEGHAGWRILRDGTNTQGGTTNLLNRVPVPGRPGYRPGPSTYSEQVLVFRVRTPRARLEELLALCDAATVLTLTDDATKEALVEIASAIPSASDTPMDAVHDVTITVVIYDGVWRDVTAVTEGPLTVDAPTETFSGLLENISAPVFDADIFMRGVFDEFTLTDSGGSWLKTTREWNLGASDKGLLYVGATKQAFLANESAPWTPLADVSQYVDVSGNGGFRLTPKLVSGNPANREVELSLVTLAQTSTTLRVRAKRAYRMN